MNKKKFVVLRSMKTWERFFTNNVPGVDPTKLADGTVGYTVIGYFDTAAECQMKLYGRVYEKF